MSSIPLAQGLSEVWRVYVNQLRHYSCEKDKIVLGTERVGRGRGRESGGKDSPTTHLFISKEEKGRQDSHEECVCTE